MEYSFHQHRKRMSFRFSFQLIQALVCLINCLLILYTPQHIFAGCKYTINILIFNVLSKKLKRTSTRRAGQNGRLPYFIIVRIISDYILLVPRCFLICAIDISFPFRNAFCSSHRMTFTCKVFKRLAIFIPSLLVYSPVSFETFRIRAY